ncbi:MAG: hypothetical protein JOZ69_09695 [Myxococcales bacterium]|nr:hypothetical protein [Myxococcales bacterium]
MAADETCGLCATVGATGDTCESDRDCEHGLVCYFTCLEPVREGEACDGMRRQCPQTLVCLDYRCVPQPGVGATCNPAADPCDHDHGLYCERETRRCAPYVVARPGAACGVETLCRRGTCATEDDPSQPGRCVANADDGMPCDSAAGPACTPPARCVRGRCAMPDPARCR